MTYLLLIHSILIGSFLAAAVFVFYRKAMLALVLLFLTTGSLMYISDRLMGEPRPTDRPPAGAVLLFAAPVPDKEIFLYLLDPDREDPQSLRLPWDDREAKKLVDAMEEAGVKGGRVQFKKPRYPGDPGEWRVELPPEPAPKTVVDGS